MTVEQETNHAFARSRSNAGLGNNDRDLAYFNWHEERRKRLIRRTGDIKALLIADGFADSAATEHEALHIAIKEAGMGISDKEIWDAAWESRVPNVQGQPTAHKD